MPRVLPEFKPQWNARKEGNGQLAYELHETMAALASVLFVETSPAPAKHALNRMGLPGGIVRPPLSELRPESVTKIDQVLGGMELI